MYDWEMPMRAKKENLETVLVSRFSFCPHGAAAFGLPLPPVQLSFCISAADGR